MSFDRAVEFVLRWEGEISDNPNDSGGLTKYGISARSFPQVRDPNFSRPDAIAIYRDKFWNACRCAELPWPLALIVFDGAVNQGQPTIIRMFQRTLEVAPDGIMGPETIAAAQRGSIRLMVSDLIARRAFAYALVPTVQRFGMGWYRRLSACHQTSLEPL